MMSDRPRVRLKSDGRVVAVNPDGSDGDVITPEVAPKAPARSDASSIVLPEANPHYTPGAHPDSRICVDEDGEVYLIHNETVIACLHNAETGVQANLLRATYCARHNPWTRWQ